MTSLHEIYAEIVKNFPTLTLNISNTRRARAKLKTILVDENAQIYHKILWLNRPKDGRKISQ